jgi:hypothetical protein
LLAVLVAGIWAKYKLSRASDFHIWHNGYWALIEMYGKNERKR